MTENADNESTMVTKTSANPPKKLPVVVWMIILGDAVHSFSDGVAIGGAYAKSFYGGLGTTVAIVFHEVPHGVGTFTRGLFLRIILRVMHCALVFTSEKISLYLSLHAVSSPFKYSVKLFRLI